MTDKEFRELFESWVLARAQAENLVDTLALVSEVAERLADDPVFGEFVTAEYIGRGSRGANLRIHGYTTKDESDGSIGLVIGDFNYDGVDARLSTERVRKLTSELEYFVREAVDKDLAAKIPEANEAYGLASILSMDREGLSRIRLHIISNASLTESFKDDRLEDLSGIAVERYIWDFRRLKAIYASSGAREALEIELAEYDCDGLPALRAAESEALSSYLTVIPGDVLAKLFDRYGSRLMEGNVRSYLGNRPAVNKGILATIRKAPDYFFAYNNGIAATVSSLSYEERMGGIFITGFKDFQIVNGGQTTATILNAKKKEKLSLDKVFVPVKINAVPVEIANELVPNISRYANSQNKVADSDFFSNHPFHRKMADISRRLLPPSSAGARVSGKWYYERTRGSYESEILYKTASDRRRVELEFPRAQVIKMGDLAKYDSLYNLKPWWASLGDQKNIKNFKKKVAPAETVGGWDIQSHQYGEDYYRDIVATAIIFSAANEYIAASKLSWFKGAHKNHIANHTVSSVFHFARVALLEVDTQKIWRDQKICESLQRAISSLAPKVQNVILMGHGNQGEWAKKEECWKEVVQACARIDLALEDYSISAASVEEGRRSNLEASLNAAANDLHIDVLDLAIDGYWAKLLRWPKLRENTTELNRRLITRASRVETAFLITRHSDLRKLYEIKSKCEDDGFNY